MKFVHIADMHFDSPFATLSDKGNLGEQRRIEQRKIFKKIIEYIKENKIEYLFIAGDLYEHKYIRKSTIEYINNLFKEIENTKIFITPGNHDPFLKKSYYNNFDWNKNVYIFNSNIQKIETEDADIYGYGFDDFYCTNSGIENIEIENPEKIKYANYSIEKLKLIDNDIDFLYYSQILKYKQHQQLKEIILEIYNQLIKWINKLEKDKNTK